MTISSWLVSQDDSGFGNECSSDGNTLLLPSRQIVGHSPCSMERVTPSRAFVILGSVPYFFLRFVVCKMFIVSTILSYDAAILTANSHRNVTIPKFITFKISQSCDISKNFHSWGRNTENVEPFPTVEVTLI